VQPLEAGNRDIAAVAGEAGARLLRGIVVPRVLRRPARALERLEMRLPRHFGVKAAIALFLTTAVAGTLIGGHGMTVVSALTAWSGFAIEEVRITGQSDASEVDVLDRLAIGPFPSLLTFDLDAAKARVEALPWVEQATLHKLYPNALEVRVSERAPFAIWQHDGALSLIDATGKVIVDHVAERYADLLLVVGAGAAERVGALMTLVDAHPEIAARVRAGVLVFGRRWTVVLDNGIELLLPEDDPAAALATIVSMNRTDALLSREVAAVDLRRPGRAILRLTEAGLAGRNALLKERDKAARVARTNT